MTYGVTNSGGNPAAPSGSIQYNNGGSFGGFAHWDALLTEFDLAYGSPGAFVFGCPHDDTQLTITAWSDNTSITMIEDNMFFKVYGSTAVTFDYEGKITPAGGYNSIDGSAGQGASVTTASLVGKTMTFKDGLLVSFN